MEVHFSVYFWYLLSYTRRLIQHSVYNTQYYTITKRGSGINPMSPTVKGRILYTGVCIESSE